MKYLITQYRDKGETIIVECYEYNMAVKLFNMFNTEYPALNTKLYRDDFGIVKQIKGSGINDNTNTM